jgi:hypothetical protein
MSVTAIIACAVLGLWLLASIGTSLGLGWLRRGVAPFDRFRVFGPWAMFAAGEGRKGAYGLAYRDRKSPDAETPWTTAIAGHHWSWHVFLLDSRRSIADAVHHLGRALHWHLRQSRTPAIAREIAFTQVRLCDYLRHLAPPPAGTCREIRVIKQLGADDSPDSEVVCQFAAPTDDER